MPAVGRQEDLIDDLVQRVEAGMGDWRAMTDPAARRRVIQAIAADIHRVLDVIEADLLAPSIGEAA